MVQNHLLSGCQIGCYAGVGYWQTVEVYGILITYGQSVQKIEDIVARNKSARKIERTLAVCLYLFVYHRRIFALFPELPVVPHRFAVGLAVSILFTCLSFAFSPYDISPEIVQRNVEDEFFVIHFLGKVQVGTFDVV